MEWERANGIDDTLIPPIEEKKAPAVEEPAKPAEEVKTEETPKADEAPKEIPDAKVVTPEAISEWTTKDPAFKAALEANPALKGEIYGMARTNAKAKGLLEIFPNAESGKYANTRAMTFDGMTQAFTQAADNPETFPAAMEAFADQFMVKTPDGKPVLDAGGNPTFGKDFEMLSNGFVDGWLESEIEDLTEIAKTSGDDNDEVALSALKFVKELKDKRQSGRSGAPDSSKLTPEQRAWQENQQKEFDAERARLGLATTKATATEKQAAREAWDKGCTTKIGASVGRAMDAFMKEKNANGVFLPSYVTEVKDPKDGQSMFVKNVFNDFNDKVNSVAHIKNQLFALANAAPTAANETARVEYYNQLVADFMPAIMEKHLRQVQRKDKADREAQQGKYEVRKEVANVEPIGGAAQQSTGGAQLSDDQVVAKLYAKIDAEFPHIDRAKRTEKMLSEFNKLGRAG